MLSLEDFGNSIFSLGDIPMRFISFIYFILLLFLEQNFSIPVKSPESTIDALVFRAALVRPARIFTLFLFNLI